VSRVDLPTTPADIAENLTAAHFCSAAAGVPSAAQFVLVLPSEGRGKLKVVGIDPTDPDSARIVQSPEVTFNGGVADPYPPVILRSTSSHPSVQLSVRVVGMGLAGVHSAAVLAPDSTWSVPLNVIEQSDSALAAVGDVLAPLPTSVLQLSASGSGTATAALPADPVLESGLASASDCQYHQCYFKDPNPAVIAKDFAFIYNTVPNPWRGLFHLYYTRRNRNLPPPEDEAALGHTWSQDLRNWSIPDTMVEFPRGSVGWDKLHVWAPTIIRQSGTYYMFYTGVDSAGDQRLGYATTALLDTSNTVWTRNRAAVFSADSTLWALVGSGSRARDATGCPSAGPAVS
jgi:hypothetical protein